MNKKRRLTLSAIVIASLALNIGLNIIDIQNDEKLNKTATAQISDVQEEIDSDGDIERKCTISYMIDGNTYSSNTDTYCTNQELQIKYEESNPNNFRSVDDDVSSPLSFMSAFFSSSFTVLAVICVFGTTQPSLKMIKDIRRRISTEISFGIYYHFISAIYVAILAVYYTVATEYATIAMFIYLWICSLFFLLLSFMAILRYNSIRKIAQDEAILAELAGAEKEMISEQNDIYFLKDSIVISTYSIRRIYYYDIASVSEGRCDDETRELFFEVSLINGKKIIVHIDNEKEFKEVSNIFKTHKVRYDSIS